MRLVPCVALVAAIPCTILIWMRGRRLAEARGGRWALVPWLGVVAIVPALIGPVLTIVSLIGTFRSVASVDGANAKSTLLAEGIDDAMGLGWWPGLVALALYFAAFFLIGLGTPEDEEGSTS